MLTLLPLPSSETRFGHCNAIGPGPLDTSLPLLLSLPPLCVSGEGRGSKVSTHRRPDGSNSARPEHVALACCKYGLLAPDEPEGDPAAAEPRDRGDGPDATIGTGGLDEREMETGYHNRQRAILACSHPKDANMERGPPKRQHALNECSHQGGEGGETLTQQRSLPAHSQGREEDTPTRQRAPQAWIQEM